MTPTRSITDLLFVLPDSQREALAPEVRAVESANTALRLAAFRQLATTFGLTADDLRGLVASNLPASVQTRAEEIVRGQAAAAGNQDRRKPRRLVRTGVPAGKRLLGMAELRVYDVMTRRVLTTTAQLASAFQGTGVVRGNAVRVARAIKCLLSLGLISREETATTAYRIVTPQPALNYADLAGTAGVYLYIRRREPRAVSHAELQQWFAQTYASGVTEGRAAYNAVSNLNQILRYSLDGLITRQGSVGWAKSSWTAAARGIKNVPTVVDAVPTTV